MLVLDTTQTSVFFEKYVRELSEIVRMGVSYETIWNKFCELTRINPKKPWLLSKEELESLDQLSEDKIFQTLGRAISQIFKGDYTGDGI
jgi:hypothetical protein